jgi:hypothetical protein
MVSRAVMALSSQAITGWFTLAAGLGGAALVGYFGWLERKGDRVGRRAEMAAAGPLVEGLLTEAWSWATF